ncbi:MAG: hypothetical protein JWN44_1095 [Myxococcales bacterium]|nr:hypothetical protein [Myxococcales bacterium]
MMQRAALAPSERRIHERNDYGSTLQLQCAGETTWFAVHGRDVSAGGFSFYCDYEMRSGERLNVWAPEIDHTVFPAVVRHVKPMSPGFVVGVQFDELLPESIERCLAGG